MLGPNPVSPTSPTPYALSTRMSVETTSPLAAQELRLKEAAMPLGPTKVVGQRDGVRHGELTSVLTSVSHL